MGKYNVNINRTIEETEVLLMMTRIGNPRDRALLATLYLTGGRPIEIQKIKAKDINLQIEEDPNYFSIKLSTAKLRERKGFEVRERTLEIHRNAPFADELLRYTSGLPDDASLFNISTTRMRQIIYKASDKKVCLYSFRHSRIWKVMRGYGDAAAMYWKGATDIRSLNPYIRAKPIGRKLDIT